MHDKESAYVQQKTSSNFLENETKIEKSKKQKQIIIKKPN